MNDQLSIELRNVIKTFGSVTAVNNVNLQIPDGEFFSLLGPSGCGKTTTLRLIAGFEMPTQGQVYIGGSYQGYLPAYQRPVNTVFQHYALFPHMSVYENVAFGLQMTNVPKTDINKRVLDALDMVHLTGMENRRPKQLSGGQQQRVALARALVNHPKVLLLDEPLGALDLKLRKAMQVELKALQTRVGITFVYVTHDQEEALTMSDRIGVMHHGKLLQVGTPQEVYESPKSRFVSDFIGATNYLEGRIIALTNGTCEVLIEPTNHVLARIDQNVQIGEQIIVAFRPEKALLNVNQSVGLNTVSGSVSNIVYTGEATTYHVELENKSVVVIRHMNRSITMPKQIMVGNKVTVSWPVEASKAFQEDE